MVEPSCEVFTFKEGVLSALGHDLRIVADAVVATVDEAAGAVTIRIDASRLRVACARRNGRDDPTALSDKQRAEIEHNMRRAVLDVRRHPTIEFRSAAVDGEGDSRPVQGELLLCGRRRSIHALARRKDGVWTTEVDLHQPDFGIEPFSAMFGAIRIAPRVRVVMRIPAIPR